MDDAGAAGPAAVVGEPVGATDERRTVVVTGSTGYVGREVAHRLVAAGFNVVALARAPGALERWPALCAAADAVVHLAAPTDDVDADATQAALDLTRRLFDALPARPVAFVFAGSMALFRPPADGDVVDERSSTYRGAELDGQDAYTRLKTVQETLVRDTCRARGDRLTIVRPSNVWDDERWLQACVGPRAGPLWFVVAPTRPLRLVHRSNCAQAFVDALRRDSDDILEVNVDDEAGVTAWRYATRVVDARRARCVAVPVPGWLFDAVASASAAMFRALRPGRRLPGLLIADRRAARFGAHRIDTGLVRERLGWRPDLRPYGIGAESS